MNARELAAELDVSEATISRLISGERRPSVEMMMKMKGRFPFWTLDDQAKALGAGKYGEILQACLHSEK